MRMGGISEALDDRADEGAVLLRLADCREQRREIRREFACVDRFIDPGLCSCSSSHEATLDGCMEEAVDRAVSGLDH